MSVAWLDTVEEEDGSWSVIDTRTGLAVIIDDDPLVLLDEEAPYAVASILNLPLDDANVAYH